MMLSLTKFILKKHAPKLHAHTISQGLKYVSDFMVAAFIAILGHTQPVDCELDTLTSHHVPEPCGQVELGKPPVCMLMCM